MMIYVYVGRYMCATASCRGLRTTCVCMCVYLPACLSVDMPLHMYRGQNTTGKTVSFYHVGVEDRAKMVRVGGKHLY